MGWLYCKYHDPNFVNSTDPSVFRILDLRASKSSVVQEYRDGKDAYTGRSIKLRTPNTELDHVVELHIVRDAIDAIPKQGMNFAKNKKLLIDFTKRNVVNEVFNLNFTTKENNKLTFEAFDAFQKDYRQDTGKQVSQGLFPYLADAYYCSQAKKKLRFERSTSSRIQEEVKQSFYGIIDALEEEGEEQPLHGFLMNRLQNELTAMRLS